MRDRVGACRSLPDIATRVAAGMKGDGFDRCVQRSARLMKALTHAGRHPKLLRCTGWRGDTSAADRRWQRLPATSWTHYVILDPDEGLVVDLSARQFNQLSTYPEYTPEAAFADLWEKVETVI